MSDLLREAVRATAGVADADALLTRVAIVLAQQADWVLADRLDEPDLVTRVAAVTASGPLELPAEAGPPSARRSSATSIGILPRALAAPRGLLRLGVDELAQIAGQTTDPHAARQARQLLDHGVHEAVVVGLVARGDALGVLSVASREPMAEELLDALPDVASHLSVALDAVRLARLQSAVARTMQESLLPALPAVPGLTLAARYVPAARGLDVGGDWYDAFHAENDLVLAIGDVTGHDLAAAARMADLRNLLRAHAVHGELAPDEVLRRVCSTAAALGLDATATVTVARLSRAGAGWRLRWCNAGHPPPLVLRRGGPEWLDPEPDLMVGVDDRLARSTHQTVLQAGESLVLFTDGLVEQRGVDLDERLARLREVASRDDAPPDTVAERLLADLAGHASDDVALMVVRAE